MIKRISLIVLILFGVLTCAGAVQAGFGISPPYVRSSKPVFSGTHYEQIITLLRSSAEDVLEAEISIDAPDIQEWVSINKGNVFDLPQGELQVPMIVMIDVPEDAEIGKYTGHINVRIRPKAGVTGSGVAIALGARVDIDLEVTDKTYIDFIIRTVKIPDIEVLKKPWNWRIFSWFFYRVKVVMKLENTGNVKVAPSRVHIDIYDLSEKNLLESHDDKSIKKIEPFITQETTATFPTLLPPAQYWAQIKIYKDKDIIHKDKVIFTIYENGALPGGTKLGVWPWLLMLAYIVVILIIILILIKIKIWRYIFKLLYILSWPLRFLWRQISKLLNRIKVRLAKWLHSKSAKMINSDDRRSQSEDQGDETDTE